MRVPMLYRAARSVLGTLFGRASPQRGATLAEDQISNSFVTVSLTNSATAFYYSTNLYTTLYSNLYTTTATTTKEAGIFARSETHHCKLTQAETRLFQVDGADLLTVTKLSNTFGRKCDVSSSGWK